MSGNHCECQPQDRAKWAIVQYHSNRSAFNGYRKTWSEYSEVKCTVCGHRWRTKARYVEDIQMMEVGVRLI